MWNQMSQWLFGNQPRGMNVSSEYSLAPVTAAAVPLLSEVDPSSSLNLNATINPNMPGPNAGFLNNYGGLALGALQGAGNLFMGMKQYGMAKKALNESTRQFNINYDAQKKLTNSRLEDRQNARIAADPNSFVSTPEYMNKYGI